MSRKLIKPPLKEILIDISWGELATIADQEKSLGEKVTMDFLLGDD